LEESSGSDGCRAFDEGSGERTPKPFVTSMSATVGLDEIVAFSIPTRALPMTSAAPSLVRAVDIKRADVLNERFLDVLVPVVPGMPAWMLRIVVFQPGRLQMAMKRPVAVE